MIAVSEPTAPIVIEHPVAHQVLQREGFVPQRAHENEPNGPALGFADVPIRGSFDNRADVRHEYRVVKLNGASGRELPWAKLTVAATGATARIDAGGWYRLEVRTLRGKDVVALGGVEPIGAGEVFVVAGQSYATNCNDEQLRVADSAARVVAFNVASKKWQIAHDPQPVPDGSHGGSIWPAFGDELLPILRVPIGFANVAVGGTSSTQWLPNGNLHPRLVEAGKSLGRFRAVLWQQGESDVIEKRTTAEYVKNVTAIRNAAVAEWGFSPPWLLAKSTLHPTVYREPLGEARIRRAIDELVVQPGFRAGPDTDVLGGENRGGMMTRRHFSGIGQRRAAAMWFASVSSMLAEPRPEHELILRDLADLKLLETPWSSPIVHRESSVLIRDGDGPITARLAFAAEEVLEIATADRGHRFSLGKEVSLAENCQTLVFVDPKPIVPIVTSDFFLPPDSRGSYRHRVGHPDLWMFYAPGRWFHDHNIEVTYRQKAAWPGSIPKLAEAELPKTIARLRSRQPLTIGVSGDSISTGLDASGLSAAAPYQPGYPDLVAAQLQSTYRVEIALHTRAVSGTSVTFGLQDLDKLLAHRPHLIVVAYGMNDVGRRDPARFGQQTRAVVNAIRQRAPDTEIILVSPMLGHAEWVHTPREMFAQYRDELKSLVGPGVALADVTDVWHTFLKSKHDFDLTGNGLNHPNDFGHRLYAQTILSLLVAR